MHFLKPTTDLKFIRWDFKNDSHSSRNVCLSGMLKNIRDFFGMSSIKLIGHKSSSLGRDEIYMFFRTYEVLSLKLTQRTNLLVNGNFVLTDTGAFLITFIYSENVDIQWG